METTVSTTNGSYQNHSPAAVAATPRSRKQGIESLLLDITNLREEPPLRRARQKAQKNLQEQIHYAPRGNPGLGAAKKHSSVAVEAKNDPMPKLLGDKAVSHSTAEVLASYTQRNTTYEVQKAFALRVMATAVSEWNCSITEAAKCAAVCCRFDAEVV